MSAKVSYFRGYHRLILVSCPNVSETFWVPFPRIYPDRTTEIMDIALKYRAKGENMAGDIIDKL
jgi:hypothetical protein